MVTIGKPAASYNFNTFQEIKSHSSILYNERMAILFYLLDMKSMRLNATYDVGIMLEVKSVLVQIYKNIRTLIRNNPTMRATLNLETKEMGVYTTDVAFDLINTMVRFCETRNYTARRLYILTEELNRLEILLKDILQYYHYFIRPDFRQKPDIELATEKYKEIADKKTIEELKEIVGKRHKIDFDSLGSKRVDITPEIEYDETVDGETTSIEENSETE